MSGNSIIAHLPEPSWKIIEMQQANSSTYMSAETFLSATEVLQLKHTLLVLSLIWVGNKVEIPLLTVALFYSEGVLLCQDATHIILTGNSQVHVPGERHATSRPHTTVTLVFTELLESWVMCP